MKLRSWRLHLLVVFVLLIPGGAIFWPFLFGDAVLLYRDIGRDSLTSYYTDFVHLSNYLRSDGFPSWSFHIGMGQDMAYATGFLFLEPVSWLPARFIAQALVYQHLLKVIIAGVFFFRFLKLRRTPLPVALLGSLLIGFSAYMTLGSCWYLPAEELLVFSAILLGAETALRRGRWLLLATAVAFVGMINPFYLYLCALFLGCYVPAALVARHGWQAGPMFKRSVVLATVTFLGVAVGAIITLPYLNVVLNSPRGSGATNSLATLSSFPIFGFESGAHYGTALLRSYANDLAGTGDGFRGWQNYFEAPQTYCGLLCLLLLPQALIGGTRRQRVTVILFLLWLVIPTAFPWFRYLFWLFKGDYYRTYSLFSVLGLVTLSTIALRRYLERQPFSLWVLAGCAALLIGLLFLPFETLRTLIDSRLRIFVIVYLLLSTAILFAGRLMNKQTVAVYALVVVTTVELVHFNRITVSDRQVVGKSELIEGFAANPETFQAMVDLKRDDHSFHRLSRLRSGAQGAEIDSNDAMLLDYYSTASYGSFNDFNYLRFLAAIEAVPSYRETDTRWTVGLVGNFIPSLFAGEKYVLVEDPEPFQQAAQYEWIREYGKSHLFRNALSLPFGLGFTRYLAEDEFLQLPRDEKEQVLLATAVLEPSSSIAAGGVKQTNSAELQQELAASSFPAIVQQRRTSALYLSSFAQNRITGDLRLEQNGILVLQMPFNRGWRAYQDNQLVSVLRANAGLLGVAIKGGEHRVELRYRNPWLVPGAIITLCSVLALGLARWRWPHLAIAGD